MKKKLLLILAAACFCAVPAVLPSCSSDDSSSETPDPNPDPQPGEAVRQDVPTPFEFYVEKTDATADGVSIEVTGKSTNNFQFVLKPGANCPSYRVDVFPLCLIYNSLFENLLAAGGEKATDAQMDEWLRSYVVNSSSMGSVIFSKEDADYAEREVDWANSTYRQVPVLPDCEYVIVAIGCFDEDGSEQGDMSICYVKTAAMELEGDPAIDINVTTSYRSYSVSYTPNSDCKYFYHLGSDYDQIQPYVDAYGEKLYIDFMRYTSESPFSADSPDDASWIFDAGQEADPTHLFMVTAIALDANGTPATKMASEVFHLLETPTDIGEAECSITVDESRIGAGIFYYTAKMEANCKTMFYHVYKKSLADQYREADAETQAEVALIIDSYGWGTANANYGFDASNGTVTGSSYEKTSFQTYYQTTTESKVLEDDEEYVMVYTGRNPYNQISQLHFSEPFHTKKRVENQPENADNSLNIEVVSTSRTSAVLRFSYDPDKVGLYYHQYVYPYGEGDYTPPQPESATREQWMNFFLRDVDPTYGNPYVNCWWPESVGYENYTLTGLEPGTRYVYAYVEEDMNGYMGEVKWFEFTTVELGGGEHPAVTVETSKEGAGFNANFKFNEDVREIRYMVDNNSELLLDYLGNSRYIYSDYIDTWTRVCMERGLQSVNETSINWEYSDRAVALCLPIGQDADGNPVYGDLVYVLWVDGEFKTLADYVDVPTSSASVPKSLGNKVRAAIR